MALTIQQSLDDLYQAGALTKTHSEGEDAYQLGQVASSEEIIKNLADTWGVPPELLLEMTEEDPQIKELYEVLENRLSTDKSE